VLSVCESSSVVLSWYYELILWITMNSLTSRESHRRQVDIDDTYDLRGLDLSIAGTNSQADSHMNVNQRRSAGDGDECGDV